MALGSYENVGRVVGPFSGGAADGVLGGDAIRKNRCCLILFFQSRLTDVSNSLIHDFK